MSRRFVLIALLVAAALPASLPTVATAAVENAAAPQQLLVGYKIGTSEAARQSARQGVQAEKLSTVVRGNSGQNEVELVRFPESMPMDAAIRAFKANPNVIYAEPNWIVTTDATTSDPYYTNGSLWGMYGDATSPTNAFGTHAGEAWANNKVGSKSVYIGVIDEGIDFNHQDLSANMWVNPGEPVDGKDNDGNGYIDDVRGWDFYSNNNTVYDGGNGDKHGTHVSGTIGAANNGVGVVGVNWNVTIISAKFLGPNGGYTSDAVRAIDYFVDLKTRLGFNIVALNNSWGGGGYSTALHEAIIRAAKADILFIAAAGNNSSNNDTTASYPCNYRSNVTATGSNITPADYNNVVAVASITSSGALSSFSNYGATTVDLGAPGSGVYSTLPGNTYGSYSGTSMATPHVTGAAALISADTGKVGSALRSQLISSVSSLSSLAGKTVTGGRLDLTSLGTAAADTTAPNVSLTATSTSITAGQSLALTASASDAGGVAKVELYSGTTLVATDAIAPYNFSWTSSVAGTFAFTAKAYDSAGNTKTSSAVNVTVNGDTAAPTSVTLTPSATTVATGKSITLTSTASDNVGIARIEFNVGGVRFATDTTSPYSVTWSTSTAGTYSFTATAFDAAGNWMTSTAVNVVVSTSVKRATK